MASRYWVGGTDNWNSTAGTKWAATSGGAGGASVPSLADDVFFDAASGAGTVTVTSSRSCLNLTFTGFTGTLAGSSNLSVYGNLILVPGMTWTHTGSITLRSTAASIITSAGKTLGAVSCATAGEWTLQDALTASSLSLLAGTFDADVYPVTAGSFASSGTTAREVKLGTDTWTLSGANPWNLSGSNLTVTPGTSVIRLTSASPTFTGADHTYYDLWMSTSGGTKVITGDNTFNTLTVAPPTTLEFEAGSTTHVTGWSADGSSGNLITVRTESDAPAFHYLVADGAPVVGDYLDIKWSVATPDASWSATNSVNSGNTVGWFAPTFARYSGTHTDVPLGDIDTLVAAADSGDVLVLAAGTHTLTEDIPAGVTLRGASCGTTTTLICSNITTLGGVTLRDLTVQCPSGPAFNPSSTTWFENCTFDGCLVYQGGPQAGETVTFNRCTMLGAECMSEDEGVGTVNWTNCLFQDQGVATDFININNFTVATTGMTYLVSHCTFVLESAGSVACDVDTYDGVIEYWNNVHYQPGVSATPFSDAGANDSGGGNFYQDDYTTPSTETYLTQVRDLGIDVTSGALRNDSPARMGAQDNLTVYTDRNYLPWSALGSRSSGCFQWKPDGSAIYRPWFLDPTSGFNFGFEPGVVPPTKNTSLLTAGVTQVNSHLEVACLIRKLVYDLAHPSLSECYVSWDGYYRILVHEFTFDLTVSGDAKVIFGASGNSSDITDTG